MEEKTVKKGSNKGKKFERNFKASAVNQEVLIVRLNDTDLSFMKSSKYIGSRFTAENPCDFIVYDYPNIFFLELKSTEYNAISIQRLPTDPKDKMIKAHQINSLVQLSQAYGAISGFVFNFRKKEDLDEDTYFMFIDDFSNFLVKTDKKSINKLDVVQYGGIKLDQKLKRTQYDYNIKKMVEDVKKEYDKRNENKENH